MTECDEDIDEILSEIGLGKFHYLNFVIMLLVVIVSSPPSWAYVFTARDTSYRCAVPECELNLNVFNQTWLSKAIPFEDGLPRKCERFVIEKGTVFNGKCDALQTVNSSTMPCSSWVFDEGDTIIKEFNMPCEDWKRSLIGTIGSGGKLVSLLFSGILSDKHGRRNVMLLMAATYGVTGLIQSFSPNYIFYLIIEFLTMITGYGAYPAMYVLMMEILLPRQRIIGSAVLDIACALGNAAVALLAWAVQPWKWFLRASAIPSFFLLLCFFAIPESFRWLNAKGRKVECVKVLKNAGELSRIKFSNKSSASLEKIISDDIEISSQLKPETDESLFTLLKIPRLAFRLLNCSFCWFSTISVYYGLSFNSVNISSEKDSFYLNFVYVSIIDIPAVLFYLLLSRYIGRKTTLFFSLLASGGFCIVYAVTPNITESLALILYLLSKMFILISLSMTYIVTSELFPTNLRNTTMNFCSVIGRIDAALAPQIPLLSKIHKSLPMIIYGLFPLISALFVFALPETKNKKLPDTIQEALSDNKN